jgi:hypothetical protein
MWNAMGSTMHSATHSAVMTVFLILTEFLFVMGISLSKKQKAGVRHSLLEAQLPSRQCFHVIFKKSSLSSESPIPS